MLKPNEKSTQVVVAVAAMGVATDGHEQNQVEPRSQPIPSHVATSYRSHTGSDSASTSAVLGVSTEQRRNGSAPSQHGSEMAEKHHQGGLSAEAFASYERRHKDSVAKQQLAPSSVSVSSTDGVSFSTASELEKGAVEMVDSVNKSSTTVGTLTSVDTLHLQVPDKRQQRVVRNLRHTYLNVYRRLFSVAFAGNLIALIIWLAKLQNTSVNALSLSDLATAAAVNFCVAILIRQDYIVNSLYQMCWLVPHGAPLRLRRMLAKVYENGGLHSGCAVAGSLWFLVLTIILIIQFANNVLRSAPVLTLTLLLLVLLAGIIVSAYPSYRSISHNTFEITHRFAGWTAIGIFWADAMLIVNEFKKKTGHSFGHELVRLPTFWILIIITFHLVLPWLRLRKWHFHAEQLSTHALKLSFDKTLPPLSGLAISESPLKEWHPFATYPKEGGGGSMIISNAGDWTKRTILDPQRRYWVKGLPKTGVLSMAFVFRKVVIVTTGSGIGPCLSFMLEPRRKTDCRVLWSTPSPLKTYGSALYGQVQSCDPEAMIIDTRKAGRPNMVGLAYKLFKESGAEAVFCISNPRLTKKIVYGMESRGVPAFGPIWDS